MTSSPDGRPALEDFLASAERWLESRYARRTSTGPRPFVWGEGSDDVRVFQEPDPAEEAEALPRIRAWRKALWDAGFAWVDGPPELGGAGLPRSYARAFEQLTRRFEVPGDSALAVSLGMIGPTVQEFGTEEQVRALLPALRAGDLVACQLFSEPDAGSDLASVRTRAVRDGEEWRVSGQKVWASGAHLADVGVLLCRTSDGARHSDLTVLLVDMHAPGVLVRPLRQMTGGSAFSEVFLEDVLVPDARRLGAEGGGWRVVMTVLGHERGVLGASPYGGAGILSTERLVALMQHMARDDDPAVRLAFGELVASLRAARALQQVQGARAARGTHVPAASGLNKLALADNMARLSAFVSQVLGPRMLADTGEWGTWAWNAVVLGAPGFRIGGGTDEILKNTLAQRVLGLPRPT
ncbi:MAG: putative acyl-CoA dehydrogenase [Frankiales bacterium]|nr:putative acyl-CoA dehydrogenase [Frankiales bacterium]